MEFLIRHSVKLSATWIEGRPCSGESDASIVATAWDFPRIAELHKECARLLRNAPGGATGEPSCELIEGWARQERAAWKAACRVDPLLPAELWPRDYQGRSVWRLRGKVMRKAARWLR